MTIVGAGPVGALVALLLAERGYEVHIYEARPDPRVNALPGGRSINLTLAERGWQALRLAGIEDVVRHLSLGLKGRAIHGQDGQVRFHAYTPRGDAIFSTSRSQLTMTLLDLVDQQPDITVNFGHRCIEVDWEARILSFVTPFAARLDVRPTRVLAADGAVSSVSRSRLRDPKFHFYQRLSPISYRELKVSPTPSGEFAFPPDALHLWPRGDCMIVGFPNLDCSFTLSFFMPAHGENSFASLGDRRSLESFLSYTCPDLFPHIEHLAHTFFNQLPAALLSSGCAPWIHEDWLTLIGDAAHTLVPFLGQGLNAGLEDCRVLLECLDRSGHRWDQALLRFQEERLDNCEAAITLAEAHFDELARAARDPEFVRRKVVEEKLHSLAPDRFVPVYTMVAFECRSYRDIARVRAPQEALLDRLMEIGDVESRWEEPAIRSLVVAELARLEVEDVAVQGEAPARSRVATIERVKT